MLLGESALRKMPDERYIYRKISGLNLPMFIYYPANNKKDILKSAVVFIHGGAWGGRTDNTEWNGDYMNVLARYFALRGTVGIIFSYRNVYNPKQNRAAFENGPELLDLYDDCLAALRYIRSHSDILGIDVNRIAVLGDSAGGHLASCLGTLDTLRTEEDTKPAVVVACNPITDLTDQSWFEYIALNTRYKEFQMLSREERAKLISPLHNITSKTSPTLVVHGTSDTVVLPWHSLEFYNKMVMMGNECRLELIEDAGHAFVLPEYYPDKAAVKKAIDIIDSYFVEKKILN